MLELLELLDVQAQQNGMPPYRQLEEDLSAASRSGDRRGEADASLEMGLRLY